jgi:hypothetical protein
MTLDELETEVTRLEEYPGDREPGTDIWLLF